MQSKTIFSLYVSYLKSLYQLHLSCHWNCDGANFYSNHILFQRLYEETLKSLDSAAEKCIGVFGELIETPSLESTIQDNFHPKTIETALRAEKKFVELSGLVYKTLESNGDMTMGVDDLIMSLINRHEEHIYLLGQSVQ